MVLELTRQLVFERAHRILDPVTCKYGKRTDFDSYTYAEGYSLTIYAGPRVIFESHGKEVTILRLLWDFCTQVEAGTVVIEPHGRSPGYDPSGRYDRLGRFLGRS